MYEDGGIGEVNFNKAAYYYQQSANQGYGPALGALSEMYARGLGVTKDLVKSKELDAKGLENFGKSLSYRTQFKQIVKYQLAEF